MRVNGSQYLPLYTYNGLANWPRIRVSQNGEDHRICFIIVTALLVSDHLYAHTHQRGGLTVINGRLVGNPICLGGNGRLEAPFTMLSRNTCMNLHVEAALSARPNRSAQVAVSAPSPSVHPQARSCARGGGGNPYDQIPGVHVTPSHPLASNKKTQSGGKRGAKYQEASMDEPFSDELLPNATSKKKQKSTATELKIPEGWFDDEQLTQLQVLKRK
jgi:hypothetical protein